MIEFVQKAAHLQTDTLQSKSRTLDKNNNGTNNNKIYQLLHVLSRSRRKHVEFYQYSLVVDTPIQTKTFETTSTNESRLDVVQTVQTLLYLCNVFANTNLLFYNTINYQLVERIIGRCSQFSTTHNYSCPDLIPILLVPVVFDCTKKQRNYGYVVAILQMVGYDLVYLLVLHHTYNPSIISFTNRCRIHMLSKFHHYCYHTSSSLLYCNYMMIHMCRCFCCKYHSCCFCSGVVAI